MLCLQHIAISHSGETQFPLLAVLEAKKAGVKSIGLTNEPGSELARSVDLLLPTQTVERPAGSFEIAPRTSPRTGPGRATEELALGALSCSSVAPDGA